MVLVLFYRPHTYFLISLWLWLSLLYVCILNVCKHCSLKFIMFSVWFFCRCVAMSQNSSSVHCTICNRWFSSKKVPLLICYKTLFTREPRLMITDFWLQCWIFNLVMVWLVPPKLVEKWHLERCSTQGQRFTTLSFCCSFLIKSNTSTNMIHIQ